jgi:hypothetical protein
MAVGTPGEDLGSGSTAISNGGAFTIINDLLHRSRRRAAYDQIPQVPGTLRPMMPSARCWTAYGPAATQLAVGIPSEDISTAADAGNVQLFSSTGTTISPGVGLTQDTTDVGGTSEAGDQFGRRVVLAPPGLSDTKTRLAVSAPFEDGPATDTGLVQIFPLDALGSETNYDQNSTGIAGTAAESASAKDSDTWPVWPAFDPGRCPTTWSFPMEW